MVQLGVGLLIVLILIGWVDEGVTDYNDKQDRIELQAACSGASSEEYESLSCWSVADE